MNSDGKAITIEYTPLFVREFKRLAKRYRSLPYDLDALLLSLKDNPLQGSDLGMDCRKVRMAISSKTKGKSGGARVITCTYFLATEGSLRLLFIYDKSEQQSVKKKFLQQMLQELK